MEVAIFILPLMTDDEPPRTNELHLPRRRRKSANAKAMLVTGAVVVVAVVVVVQG
jgi:hypothetical protein